MPILGSRPSPVSPGCQLPLCAHLTLNRDRVTRRGYQLVGYQGGHPLHGSPRLSMLGSHPSPVGPKLALRGHAPLASAPHLQTAAPRTFRLAEGVSAGCTSGTTQSRFAPAHPYSRYRVLLRGFARRHRRGERVRLNAMAHRSTARATGGLLAGRERKRVLHGGLLWGAAWAWGRPAPPPALIGDVGPGKGVGAVVGCGPVPPGRPVPGCPPSPPCVACCAWLVLFPLSPPPKMACRRGAFPLVRSSTREKCLPGAPRPPSRAPGEAPKLGWVCRQGLHHCRGTPCTVLIPPL